MKTGTSVSTRPVVHSFGIYKKEDVLEAKLIFCPGRQPHFEGFQKIEPESNKVILNSGKELHYDLLIIATGTRVAPEETPGLKGELWYKDVFDFYTLEGSLALARKLRDWEGEANWWSTSLTCRSNVR